jgi:glyoxylase-like metal-dependent hydrolase (beta-lactamase superfamily II)
VRRDPAGVQIPAEWYRPRPTHFVATLAGWNGERAVQDRDRAHALVDRAPREVQRHGTKLKIVDGVREVLPGITVHRVGGHTAGLQIVSVKTQSGTVVLTSDASHFYRNVETGQPTQIITSLPEMLAGFDTIHELAGKEKLIVAGHDPQVADRFKQVGPGIIKIARAIGQ